MKIEEGKFYTSNDNTLTVYVTSVIPNTVIEDVEVEYYALQPQCFSSIKFFEDNFKEAKYG